MGKLSHVKYNSHQKYDAHQDRDKAPNIRTNLNDLLYKREEEKKVDRKNNLIIISGASLAALAIVTVLSL